MISVMFMCLTLKYMYCYFIIDNIKTFYNRLVTAINNIGSQFQIRF